MILLSTSSTLFPYTTLFRSHKVAAIFETESDANGVARVLSQDTSLDHEQVIVVSPQDQHPGEELEPEKDRKSTRLNSSHVKISYAVFCLKKKKISNTN